jgi:carbon monoxide dehydrogenase subunit G
MKTSASIEIDRPSADVFAYTTDPTTFAEWQEGIEGAEPPTHTPPAVGDQCVTVRKIGMMSRRITSEIAALDPPRTWTMRGLDGPIRATVDVTVEPLDSDRRSKVTIDIDFSGHGAGKVMVPLMVVPMARREMPANMARLKQRLEATGSDATS